MYGNPRYGYGVYKKNQVSVGNPFAIQPPVDQTRHPLEQNESMDDGTGFVSVDSLEKARRDAALIIREAEFEAERLLSEARDRIVTEAVDVERRAREEGYSDGERQAMERHAALVAEAEQVLEEARAEYRGAMEALEGDMVGMVLEIARKVIGAELSENPDTILSIIRSTLADVTPTDRVIVKVSPDDYSHAIENQERLSATLGFLCELDIRRDASLSRGACVLDTGRGTVDGSAATRLSQIEEAFRALLGGRMDTPVIQGSPVDGEE